MNKNRARKSISGTSLIELLVVIVVFLIGILTIAQIFPGGLRILSTTRAESMATTMSHATMDYLRSHSDELPKEIVPITYSVSGGVISPSSTPVDTSEDSMGPEGVAVMPSTGARPASWGFTSSTWDVFDASGNDLGPWQLLSGANNVRHVVGENKTVPAPRQVGNTYGCLLTLLFGPIVQGYANDLVLYGNDLQKSDGPPSGNVVTSANAAGAVASGNFLIPGFSVPTYKYCVDDTAPAAPVLYLPMDSNQQSGQNVQHTYRISLLFYYNTGAGVQQGQAVIPLTISAIPSGIQTTLPNGGGCYYIELLSDLLNTYRAGLGASLISVNEGSVEVEREFDPITASNPMDLTYNPDGTPHNPYQFEVLNSNLGQVLINPLAYGYVEESQAGKPVPLVAQVDYDVLDWRVLHEDFRLPDATPFVYQLHVNNLKHVNGYEPDQTFTSGIATGLNGSTSGAAVIVADENTGGIFTTSSFSVDYHLGLITFKPNPTSWSETVNTLNASGAVSGTTTIAPNVNDLSLRVYYMANSEWSCQVLKSAANYFQATTLSPALYPGEFYVLPPSSGVTSGSTAVQFCKADIGQTVSFDEIWYQTAASTAPICARGQSAVVKVIGGNPVINIADIDPQATTLDFSNGYAVKGVKGLSVTVRVLWNPNTVKFKTSGTNLGLFDTYLSGWRNTSTEAILDRGLLQQ